MLQKGWQKVGLVKIMGFVLVVSYYLVKIENVNKASNGTRNGIGVNRIGAARISPV